MAITTLDSHTPHVDETRINGVEVFVLAGEFDAFSAPQLEDRLIAAIERGSYEVVVDMSAVTFIDLSTLNAIIRAMKLVYRHNGHLVVGCDSRPVLRAIDLAGLRHSMRVFATRDEAIAAVVGERNGRA
ncbi:MAG: STAS domain-containing protein [Thermoleophilaceae bacterium]